MTNEEMTEWEIVELKPQNIIEPTEWTWKQENTVIDPDGNAICEEIEDE